MSSFCLVPYSRDELPSGVAIEGEVTREGSTLRAHYRLLGDSTSVLIAPPSANPARKDGLWQSTCVELFVAAHARAGYLEVNLSPSGDWNVYRFAGYRDGMETLHPAHFSARIHAAEAKALPSLEFTLGLPPDVATEALDIGVSAVMNHGGSAGRKSYWALAHPGERPDFHRRDSLLLTL